MLGILGHVPDMPVIMLEKMNFMPVMHYGSEVWGFDRIEKLNRVYTYFLKRISGRSKSVANCSILFEFGAFDDIIHCKIRALKYWLRVIQSEQTKLRAICYNYQSRNVVLDVGLMKFGKDLKKIGMGWVWAKGREKP